ncbi:Ras-related protein Rab-4B [Trichinella papuae]|uniref:Ras-related protein Rab-4B n=1 Tax=Trichinella papuae TaxID=268474 RepID=A0A0V1M6M8_9BILA|nr:Ras-related protein Rab-4B [Trichinella papuae]
MANLNDNLYLSDVRQMLGFRFNTYLHWLKLWVHKEIDDDAMYAFVHQAFPSEKRSLHDDFFISLVNDVCKIDFGRNVKRNRVEECGRGFLKDKLDKSSEDSIPALKREQSIWLLRSLCASELSKLALFLLAFSKDIDVIHEDALTCLLDGSEILIKNRMEDIIQAARSRMNGSEEVCLKCAVVKHQTSPCAETETKVEDSQSESIKCRVTLEDIIYLNFLSLEIRELANLVYFTNFWKINLNKTPRTRLVSNRSIKLQVWDTAGQERFRSLTKNYYNGAACALLVYDITWQSFNAIAQWLSDARSLASPQIIKDLEDRREVTFMEASQFAQENGMLFLETSALTGENIEETFLRCARSILTKIESGELDPNRVGYGIQFGHVEMKPIKNDRPNARALVGEPIVGGLTPADDEDPKVRQMIQYAVEQLNEKSKEPFLRKLITLKNAAVQVVQGALYHLNILVAETDCKKGENVENVQNCKTTPHGLSQECFIKIWEREWLNFIKVMKTKCKEASLPDVNITDTTKPTDDLQVGVIATPENYTIPTEEIATTVVVDQSDEQQASTAAVISSDAEIAPTLLMITTTDSMTNKTEPADM